MRYRRESVDEIEAIQWTGNNIEDLWTRCGAGNIYGPTETNTHPIITPNGINIRQGTPLTTVGDWVIGSRIESGWSLAKLTDGQFQALDYRPASLIETTPAGPESAKLTAIRWLRNGDHPGDKVGEMVEPASTDGPDAVPYRRREGLVVRYFRHPDHPGDQQHNGPDGCYQRWHDHGWTDDAPEGHTVCPGDLVVDLPDGGHEVLKLGSGAYRDRNDHYVPAGMHLTGPAQYAEISAPRELERQGAMNALENALRLLIEVRHYGMDTPVRTREEIDYWISHNDPERRTGWSFLPRPARTARVVMAKPDELNRDHSHWWWADMSGEPFADGGPHWAVFRGHRVQVDIGLRTSNRREVNDWKGRDEIRAEGVWTISLNRQQVYEGSFGDDVFYALRKIETKLRALLDEYSVGLDHSDPRPYAEQLQGRRVYYDKTPAVVSSTVLDQGCVILRPVGVPVFPRSVYELDAAPDGTGHDEQDLYDEGENRQVKVEIDSPLLHWERRRPFDPDEVDERYRPTEASGEIQGEADHEGAKTPDDDEGKVGGDDDDGSAQA